MAQFCNSNYLVQHYHYTPLFDIYVTAVCHSCLKELTFISVLNVQPDVLGDPREILSYFEENYEQITMSYSFTFTQESNKFPFYICNTCTFYNFLTMFSVSD